MAHRLVFILLAALALSPAVAQDDDDAEIREARWKDLRNAVFGARPLLDGTGVIELEAPPRALDAATVPVALKFTGQPVKGAYLIIDNNPAPLAAHFTFGPKADASGVKLRVRVDQYTLMHAVAETQDGKLYVVERFVKASGGCSAPAGPNNAQTLAETGRMKLKVQGTFAPGKPLQAQLMIRHPNFNGMQMDPLKMYYTPAHFIRSIDVSYEGEPVLRLDSDISLSTDPVITFGFVPQSNGRIKVVARDTKDATFDQSFDIPAGDS